MIGVLSAWLVEVGLITWRDFKRGSTGNIAGLPIPADYLATFVIYGALGMLGHGSNPDRTKLAGITAWGFTIATALQVVDPTKVPPKLGKSDSAAQKLGGPTGPGTGSATNQAPGTTTAGGRG